MQSHSHLQLQLLFSWVFIYFILFFLMRMPVVAPKWDAKNEVIPQSEL